MVSREFGATAATLSGWRGAFQHNLADRATRLPATHCDMAANASTRGPSRVGSQSVSQKPRALHDRMQTFFRVLISRGARAKVASQTSAG